MSRQQLNADIAENREEENMSEEEVKAQEQAWDETLNSPESANFLDSLVEKAMKEIEEKK